MSKEPWKKAHNLSRLRQEQSSAKMPPTSHTVYQPGIVARRSSFSLVVGIILVVLILGAGVLYFTRETWWPATSQHLPEQVSDAVEEIAPELQLSVDWHALDTGLGADLKQFTSYLDFVGKTGEWGAPVKLIQTGTDRWRITAPGLKVYVQDGMIWTYELEFAEIYADERWKPWWPELRSAGLVPELTWEDVTGDPNKPRGHAEHRMRRTPATRVREGWVYPVFILHFNYGELSGLEGAVDFGVSEQALPEGG